MKLVKIFFFAIIAVAIFFRLYSISNIPSHPSLDEASIGYNAFSIFKTGADEFGEKLPVLLRAYDDYRPAHYTYLVIPFIVVFNLNVVAVRLPSVILSVLTLVSVYFLTKEIFLKHNMRRDIALLTVGFLSISPWHLYISRLGHEVNLFFSTFIFGITFFYLFINKRKNYYLVLSSVFFALSFSSYQSGKIFIPILIVALVVLYFRQLVEKKIVVIISVCVFLLISMPVLLESTKPHALIRFQATNIYSLAEPYLKQSAQNVLVAKESNDIVGQIINNRRLVYVVLPVTAYLSHFNPMWLLTNGGDEPFKVPQLGLLYVYELPIILVGAYLLFSSRKIDKKIKILISIWFFASILPAAITTGFPHAMRAFQVLPLPQILIAMFFGVVYQRYKRVVVGVIVLIMLFSCVSLYNSYFELFPKQTAHQFQYGVLEAMNFAYENESKYDAIYVSNKNALFQSYMFYLYNSRYDPFIYQKSGGSISGGFASVHRIGKYHFGDLDIVPSNSLIISNPNEAHGKKIKTIHFPNGKEAIWILEKE